MEWAFKPVLDKDGNAVLFDMFDHNDDWHGSRRTMEQCQLYQGWAMTTDLRTWRNGRR